MASKNKSFVVKRVPPSLADELITTLSRRLMVVTDEALHHLVQRKVIGAELAGACCKPDGGTCCPNRSYESVSGREKRS